MVKTHGPFRGFTTSGARICPSSLAPFSLLGTRTCSEKRYPKHVWVVLWLIPRNHGKFHVAAGQRKDVKKLETNLAKTKKQSLTILYGTRRAFFLGILLFWLGNWLTFCSCSQLRSDRPSMFQGTGSGTSTWTWDTHGVVGTFAAKKPPVCSLQFTQNLRLANQGLILRY